MATSNKTIYQVDAFTTELFKGNPAAVMVLDEMPTKEYMQHMAMEMNLSETAFVVPQKDTFRIRYFTPKAEIPVAGHPTLASAHILYEIGLVPESKEITFEANVATLKVKKDGDLIVMNLPAFPIEQIDVIQEFEELVGFQPIEMYSSLYNWKIAVAENMNDVIHAKPQFSQLGSHGLGHLMVTSISNSSDEDFVVRCFVPDLGVDEDPVTGSAHCALTPLWAKKLNKLELMSKQLSERTGELQVKLIGDRVEIKGYAITVFEATLK